MKNQIDEWQLIENLKSVANGLDNLGEKDALEYEDVMVDELPEAERVKEFEDIAWELAEMICAHKFREEDNDGAHPFLNCPKELAQQVGIDEITVCPYKGEIHNAWLDSNFMWYRQADGFCSLTIDVYSTRHAFKDTVYDSILQELYNFKRDAGWFVDGVYEEEIKKFKP